MKKWQVVYSQQAYQDLRDIYQYIARELLAQDTANKLLERILTKIENLDEMPMRNPLYEKEPWRSRGLRKLVVDNYVAFYLPVEMSQQVVVISVMYGGRNIKDILLKKED